MRKYYHQLFFELYNPKYIHIGNYWLEKIKRKTHYTYKSMRKTCICIKWFVDNYDINKFVCSLDVYGNYYGAFIHDDNDEIVDRVFLKTNNGIYTIESIYNDKIYKGIDQCDYLEK